MNLPTKEIISKALEAGFSLSTAYGQDTDKFMPFSDTKTLKKFAELILSTAVEEERKELIKLFTEKATIQLNMRDMTPYKQLTLDHVISLITNRGK